MLVRVTLARALCEAARPLSIVPILCCAAPIASAGEPPWPGFVPDPQTAENLTLAGTTWTSEEPTHTVHLRQVDQAERLRYIEGRTGVAVDPYAAPAGQDPPIISFLLVIENRGDAVLSFNALDCWLTTNRQQIETPLGLTDLSFDYLIAGLSMPAAYQRVAPVLLEGTRTLAPGESLSGLLIYHAVDARARRFHIDVELTAPTGDKMSLRAPYRRPKDRDAPPGEGAGPSS